MDDLEAAWNDLHDVVRPGWVAGRPMLRDDTHVWEQYAYRPKERHDAGKRHDEWLATATTEAGRRGDGALPQGDPRGPLADVGLCVHAARRASPG